MGQYFETADFRGPTSSELVGEASLGRAFVAKVDMNGAFAWRGGGRIELPHRRRGGSVLHIDPEVAVSPDGDVTIVGFLEGTHDFDPSDGEALYTAAGSVDVYATRFASDGTHRWTRTWSSDPLTAEVAGEPSLAAAPDGSVVLAGVFGGIRQLAKLGADGSELWSVPLANASRPVVAVAGDGTSHVGYIDTRPVIARYDASGTLIDAVRLEAFATVNAIAVAADGGTLISGTFSQMADFAPGMTVTARVAVGGLDAFVASYAPDRSLRWVHGWGGLGNDDAWSVAVGVDGSVHAAGAYYKTTDFDPGEGIDERTARGQDAVFTLYAADGGYLGTRTWGSDGDDRAVAIAAATDGRAYVIGEFAGTLNFASAAPGDVRTGRGHADGFLLAVPRARDAEPSGPSCEPIAVSPTQTDPRLAGTGLPQHYADCVQQGFGVYYDREGNGVCAFDASDDEPLFAICESVGGGISVGESSPPVYFCSIIYSEVDGPCFGNACD